MAKEERRGTGNKKLTWKNDRISGDLQRRKARAKTRTGCPRSARDGLVRRTEKEDEDVGEDSK
jgi:hypothetical protein